jgi:hypothetical protein
MDAQAQQSAKAPRRKFAFKAAPVETTEGSYQPLQVKDGPTAIHALLAITLAHTADVFEGIVDAIHDHYKIDKEEMMRVVVAHPAYTSIQTSKILNDLGYFSAAKPEPKKKFIVKKPTAE